MAKSITRVAILALALAALAVLGRAIWLRVAAINQEVEAKGEQTVRLVPVEVASVTRGPIERRRVVVGTLTARAQISVAAKVGGRVVRLEADLGDAVSRGAVVAELDNDEFMQAVARAEADLSIADARLTEARARLEIAERSLVRARNLMAKGVSAVTEVDEAESEKLVRAAAVEVAVAQARRARSEVETARTRLGYTRVTADWTAGKDVRYVAERLIDVGDTAGAEEPLLSVVELDPINTVVFVTERDYGSLHVGQDVELTTSAFPDRSFAGTISRIAPAFRSTSRQARVELAVANPELHLKPGMFARVEIVLEHVENAVIVPASAIVIRGGESGVFRVIDGGRRVAWCTVEVGIQDGDRVQVTGLELEGPVVVLGHQFIDDGSEIVVPDGALGGATE